MAVFLPSTIVEVVDADDPDGPVVQHLEVASARGGGLIYAPTAGRAGQIAGEEDRAALRLTHDEAMRLVNEHAWAMETWTVRDDPDHEADGGPYLSMLENAHGDVAGWCVRDIAGEWLTEVQPEREKALELVHRLRAEREAGLKPD